VAETVKGTLDLIPFTAFSSAAGELKYVNEGEETTLGWGFIWMRCPEHCLDSPLILEPHLNSGRHCGR